MGSGRVKGEGGGNAEVASWSKEGGNDRDVNEYQQILTCVGLICRFGFGS
jgi:hypothetical protein